MNKKYEQNNLLASKIWQDIFIISALLLSISTIIITYFKDIGDHDLIVNIITVLLLFALLVPSAKLLGKVLDIIKSKKQQ